MATLQTEHVVIQKMVCLPALKRAAADFSFMIVVVPIILGVWAGIPEFKDLVTIVKEEPKQLDSFEFKVVVILAGIGYVALFVAKVTMASPMFHFALSVGTICKWMILFGITLGMKHWSNVAIYGSYSLVVTIFITVLEQVETGRLEAGGRVIDSISYLISIIVQRVALVAGHEVEFEGSESSTEEDVSGPNPQDNIKALTMQFFFSNLLEIVKEGASFMYWATFLILGYGNLVKIFQKSTSMRVYVTIYACIGCVSFNAARICRSMSFGFLFLAWLGMWMQMCIWGTVLVNIHSDSSYIPVIVVSFFLTLLPIVLKFTSIHMRREVLNREMS